MNLFKKYILNEDIPSTPTPDIDITNAVDRGLRAFWQEIQKSFPNIKAKSLMPDQANDFRKAALKVVEQYLNSNSSGDQSASVSFSSFNRDSSSLQTQQWNDYHP